MGFREYCLRHGDDDNRIDQKWEQKTWTFQQINLKKKNMKQLKRMNEQNEPLEWTK